MIRNNSLQLLLHYTVKMYQIDCKFFMYITAVKWWLMDQPITVHNQIRVSV